MGISKEKRLGILFIGLFISLLLTNITFVTDCFPAAKWTLKYQSMTVRGSKDAGWQIDEWLAKEIEKRTGGAVTITLYGSGELIPWGEMVKATEKGTIDMFHLMDSVLRPDFPGIEWNNTALRLDWPKGVFDFWEKSGVKEIVSREFAKRNLKIISYFEWGDGQCFISKKAFFKKSLILKALKFVYLQDLGGYLCSQF